MPSMRLSAPRRHTTGLTGGGQQSGSSTLRDKGTSRGGARRACVGPAARSREPRLPHCLDLEGDTPVCRPVRIAAASCAHVRPDVPHEEAPYAVFTELPDVHRFVVQKLLEPGGLGRLAGHDNEPAERDPVRARWNGPTLPEPEVTGASRASQNRCAIRTAAPSACGATPAPADRRP